MMRVKEYQPFSKIPSRVLWEILGRVPLKTCLACKLVCKEWYHIVVNPDFSSFRHQCNFSHSTLLFHGDLRDDGKALDFNLVEIDRTLDLNGPLKCIGFSVPLEIDTSNGICLWFCHSNGVVCVASTMAGYFVYNLLTGQRVNLQNLHELRNQSYISRHEVGFCSMSRQFKVLVFLLDKEKNILLAKIQTLGKGEWRSIGNAPFKIRTSGSFLNESSHWCCDNCLWSFHFGKEKFSQIPLPDDAIIEDYKKNNKILSVFDSCLCLSCFSEGVRVEIDIWIMKEYGVKESWVRQFVIVNDPWSKPLVPMDEGKILLQRGGRLYLYDLQTHMEIAIKGFSGTWFFGTFHPWFSRF